MKIADPGQVECRGFYVMKQGERQRHSVAHCPPGPKGLAEARRIAGAINTRGDVVAYMEADVRSK
ncbi:hypothetical protein AB0I84_01990 [Streptomyces spectabilis]|uniref:hypothetical protein n=1 Tax=Streptomyces spectabilis TaxID=68270 RepID=UPI0033E249F5